MSKLSIAPSRVQHRDVDNPSIITGPVYIASSLSTYRTPRYDRMIESIRTLFPQSNAMPARDQFTSNADWRRKWPDILPTIAAVVFFDDGDGYLGLGVWTEITDCFRIGLPLWYIDDDGGLHHIDGGTFSGFPGFEAGAVGDSHIVLFPYMANPESGVIDPKRCVLMGSVERSSGHAGLEALRPRLEGRTTLQAAVLAYTGEDGTTGTS